MRLLLISYSYTPVITPRSFRWSAIADQWVKQGHTIDVISAMAPGSSKCETLNGVSVYRAGIGISEVVRSRIVKQPPTLPSSGSNFNEVGYVALKLKRLHDCTWRRIYWPDYACLWYFPAINLAFSLLKKFHYDALISVSNPFTGHLVGLRIKKRFTLLPWLVDIGDPFCFAELTPSNNQIIFKHLNLAVEGKVLGRAEVISVTTQGTLDRYVDTFPDCIGKIHVIPPLLSLPDASLSYDLQESDPKVKLVFVGTLYRSIRNPDFLLKLFIKLLSSRISRNIELHFWGGINDCGNSFTSYNHLIGTKIFLHDKVSRMDIFTVIQNANVLVNIGNSTPYQLPSKLVEYINTRKPILNLIKISEDSSKEFLSRYPATLSIIEDQYPTSDDVERLVQFIEKPPVISKTLIEDWISSFRVATVAGKYEKLITECAPSL